MDFTGIVGILGTLSASIITQLFTSLREKRRLELEIRRFEIEHPPYARFESIMNCQFHRPIKTDYMAVVYLSIHNIGSVDVMISSINIRIRGISGEEEFTTLNRETLYGSRVSFPLKIVEDEVLPKAYNYAIFQAGSKNEYTYTTLIPETVKYILITSRFINDQGLEHRMERIFEVKPLDVSHKGP